MTIFEFKKNGLGDLANPKKFHEPLDISGQNPEKLIEQLRMMLLIREVEEFIGDKIAEGKIVCPCHLCIGQEAIAVGVSANLFKTDRVFGGHRSHSHYLALGGSVYGLLAEILGKNSGCSKGMGGSMHLFDAPNGFIGSVPIVAGTVPMAVGAALAAKKDDTDSIGVAYFGDGAIEEGVVHESLNFASTFKLPILFICENNFFSSHLHINLRQPSNCVSRFAAAHLIEFKIVDGNDVVAVSSAAAQLIEKARKGNGPGFLEAVTYRWRGHVGHREDIDVGVNRSEELILWKKRDPIQRLFLSLQKEKIFSQDKFLKMKEEIKNFVKNEWERAEKAPYPELIDNIKRVYKENQ